MRRSPLASITAAMAVGLLLAGCSATIHGEARPAAPAAAPGPDGASPESGEPRTAAGAIGVIGDQPAGSTPVDGGTLEFASYSLPVSLDPIRSVASGTTGGTEMAAVYDVLVRYDAATEIYEPQLAESLTEGPDKLTWTLRLRDGVTFSDGAPLDADAVIASTNRFNAQRGMNSELFADGVRAMEAPDSRTVRYSLNQPWPEFPALLAAGHGMVVAPAAEAGGQFTPIGAGAYILESNTPGSELVLKSRADYWGGKPHLDTLRFTGVAGDRAKLDALTAGAVDMAYLREPATVADARREFPGYLETTSLGSVLQINNREGRPGADARVRQAIARAVDPVAIAQAAQRDPALAGSPIFLPWSKWRSDEPGAATDVEEATRLLAEAKADGYDGRLSIVTVAGDPLAEAQTREIQSSLESVGFAVAVKSPSNVQDLVKVLYVDHDFDLAMGAYSVLEAAPTQRLSSALHSDSANNMLGLRDPGVDALLGQASAATTTDARRAALAELQAVIDTQAPFVPIGAGVTFLPWSPKVHGVVPSLDAIMLLDGAWIG